MADELTAEEQQTLVDQFEEAHRQSQDTYDASVRTIAAASVGVTASLTAAFQQAGWSGTLAVALSLCSLVANLASYWTAQLDIQSRIGAAWERDRVGVFGGRWRKATTALNATTGVLLLAAGVCLVIFVSSAS